MSRTTYSLLLAIFLFAGASSVAAQQINPRNPPPPPPAESPSTSAAAPAAAPSSEPASTDKQPTAPAQPIDPTVPPPPPTEDSAVDPPAPSGPAFDPLHAGRSIDIGKFYLNKGSYDAAIDRFIEASNYQPSLGAPWKYLGEAYEKKHEYAKALDAYNKYLQILPHAADAAKINRLISDLQEKTSQDSTRK